MTSKEVLEESRCLLASNQVTKRYSDIFEENLLQPIEKDLEVLEILKKNEISISYIEQSTSYDDYISSCDYFRNLSYITEEEYELVKGWLENDK